MDSEFIKDLKPEIVYLHGDAVVPAKDLSYKKDKKTGEIIEKVRPNTHRFEIKLKNDLNEQLKGVEEFPTNKEVLITLNCGFHSKTKYKGCDLDNTAKTILDALRGPVYDDDSQVKFLITYKDFLENSQESYFRFTVKILNKNLIVRIKDNLINYQKYSD